MKADRVVWAGKDPVAFVVSTNLHRRHLNSSQRAMIAETIAQLRHGGDRKSKSQICDLKATPAEAASLLNVSKRNVERARQVKEKGVPELAAAAKVEGRAPTSTRAPGDRITCRAFYTNRIRRSLT